MLQLLEAISYIHDRNIAHLDIKVGRRKGRGGTPCPQPQNIVLMSEFPNCDIKLCDLEVG